MLSWQKWNQSNQCQPNIGSSWGCLASHVRGHGLVVAVLVAAVGVACLFRDPRAGPELQVVDGGYGRTDALMRVSKPTQDESKEPIDYFDKGYDRDAGEETQGAADSRDHVKDVGLELQIDLGDDGGVEEKVDNSNVLTKPLLGQVDIVGQIVGQEQKVFAQLVDQEVLRVQEVVGQEAFKNRDVCSYLIRSWLNHILTILLLGIEPSFFGHISHHVKGLSLKRGKEVNHFAIVFAITIFSILQVIPA